MSDPAAPASPTSRERGEVIGVGVSWAARWSGRWLLILLALTSVVLLLGRAWSIVMPLALALILASVLAQPSRFLERRLKLPPALAAATTLLGTLGVLVGVGFAIAPSVRGQSGKLVDAGVKGLQQLQDWVQQSDFVTSAQIDDGIEAIQDRLAGSGGEIAAGLVTGVGSAASAVVTLVLALIVTFLVLKDGRRFIPLVRRVSGRRAGPHLVEVLQRSWTTLGGYIRTQAIVSAVDAVLIGIALLIMGVPLAIPLALLTFFGGFIPIVGAFAVGGLSVMVALVSNGVSGAIIILVVIIAVQQLEGNVLSPWLQAKSMKLHAGVVLLGVALGGTLFGITGAFLAVPFLAVLAVVVRYLDEVVAEVAPEDSPDDAPSTEDVDADSDAEDAETA